MKSTPKLLLTVLRIVLGIALFWLAAGRTGGWSLASLALNSPTYLLPVVAYSFFGGLVEALRLTPLLRSQGVTVTVSEAFRLGTAAFALNFCIPGGATGDLSKLYYLRAAHPGKGWELATIVFVDRLVGLLSMLILITMLGFASWPLLKTSAVLAPIFGVAVLLMAGIFIFSGLCLYSSTAIRPLVRRILSGFTFGTWLSRIAEAFFQFSSHKGALVRSLFFSFLGNLAQAGLFGFLGGRLFPALSPSLSALLSMFGIFANLITITPGGLGVGEVAFDRLFAAAGVRGGAAQMVVWRAGMVPFCLVGLAFYLAGLGLNTQIIPSGPKDDERAC